MTNLCSLCGKKLRTVTNMYGQQVANPQKSHGACRDRAGRAKDLKTFEVTIGRIVHDVVSGTVSVKASTLEEAQRIALEDTDVQDTCEMNFDYQYEDSSPVYLVTDNGLEVSA